MTDSNSKGPEPKGVDFGRSLQELGKIVTGNASAATIDLWEYQPDSGAPVRDAGDAVAKALAGPIDFPPLEMVVVQGDRVALAVDPNIPQLAEIVVGVVRAVSMTDAEHVDIVLSDEATDQTLQAVNVALADAILDKDATVHRHDSADRESLRYLGAGANALPWYVNRQLVDADVVIPIVTKRPAETDDRIDATGIYPVFADSATRHRFRDAKVFDEERETQSPEFQIPWLIGVQLMVTVAANHDGMVRQVMAGAPQSLAIRRTDLDRDSDEFPPAAALVIASTDGDAQQQTWANAARAAVAASRFVRPGGTILVWTDIDVDPDPAFRQVLESEGDHESLHESSAAGEDDAESLPPWDESIGIGMTFARVLADNRVVMRSRLDAEVVETLGLGSLRSIDELKRLIDSFENCGVLRGASFVADAVAANHRSRIRHED
tara:strand:- start:93890 stop:95197 length:1308 start_codon:yes stop_codon:yes gene_type:complete